MAETQEHELLLPRYILYDSQSLKIVVAAENLDTVKDALNNNLFEAVLENIIREARELKRLKQLPDVSQDKSPDRQE